ncbi:MAG TPA: MBL fold metallo-hydrolase [Candidatus Limnocylindria bacterium]|nr:MBL fold metallo-hydrolase [Candidatus Limnocylindria bacterium]
MEITSFGETCLRFKGREGVVVADAYPSVVGPTGRGLTADIATYSRPDDRPTLGLEKTARKRARSERPSSPLPTSLQSAFMLDSPGEFEVHEVLITGVRTFRDDSRGGERGPNVSFVYELDGLHALHLGDIGHLLDEEMLGEVGTIDVACVPVGGVLSASRAAELVAQLDAKLVVPMPVESNGASSQALAKFLHEMSVQHGEPVARLSVSFSSLPQETTVALLEPRVRG